jgi:DNA-binding XRE family transcriptional regulator
VRDRNHYLRMFESAGTVGVELLARAIHTVRTGVDERAPEDLVRALKKRHGDQVWSEQALMLLADEGRESFGHPGAALVAAREVAGMTQADLAALSGVSRRTIQHAEKGERDLGVQTLGRLARALGVEIVSLLEGWGEEE